MDDKFLLSRDEYRVGRHSLDVEHLLKVESHQPVIHLHKQVVVVVPSARAGAGGLAGRTAGFAAAVAGWLLESGRILLA
jgi:hypothetical protein